MGRWPCRVNTRFRFLSFCLFFCFDSVDIAARSMYTTTSTNKRPCLNETGHERHIACRRLAAIMDRHPRQEERIHWLVNYQCGWLPASVRGFSWPPGRTDQSTVGSGTQLGDGDSGSSSSSAFSPCLACRLAGTDHPRSPPSIGRPRSRLRPRATPISSLKKLPVALPTAVPKSGVELCQRHTFKY